jgi:membrane protein DedA with SNARE-associated domain
MNPFLIASIIGMWALFLFLILIGYLECNHSRVHRNESSYNLAALIVFFIASYLTLIGGVQWDNLHSTNVNHPNAVEKSR